MNDSKGLVSIIMPSYNCAKFVTQSINSIQSQEYKDWELLFVDDCSTDNTKQIVEELASVDKRIKYYCLETNSGAAAARNLALRMAKGKWVAFLDSDDLWLPQKLKNQINFMETNNFFFTYHKYHEISEDCEDLNIQVGGKKTVTSFDMFACCWPGCLSVMYNREQIGLIQTANIKKNNDTAIWLKAIRYSKCHFLDEDLAAYRRRKGSITPPTIWKKIWAHYPLFRVSEQQNSIVACFWTFMNVFGNTYKKLFYIKRIRK